MHRVADEYCRSKGGAGSRDAGASLSAHNLSKNGCALCDLELWNPSLRPRMTPCRGVSRCADPSNWVKRMDPLVDQFICCLIEARARLNFHRSRDERGREASSSRNRRLFLLPHTRRSAAAPKRLSTLHTPLASITRGWRSTPPAPVLSVTHHPSRFLAQQPHAVDRPTGSRERMDGYAPLFFPNTQLPTRVTDDACARSQPSLRGCWRANDGKGRECWVTLWVFPRCPGALPRPGRMDRKPPAPAPSH